MLGIGVLNGVNIGINFINCVVQVNQFESVVVDFGNIVVLFGGSDCVLVIVSNFINVLFIQFIMNWDEFIWLYNGMIQNENFVLVGVMVIYMLVGLVFMGFQMDNGIDLIILMDGSVLFEICFDIVLIVNFGECDELIIVGLLFVESVIIFIFNGDNIGLIINLGDLCIFFFEGFGMIVVSIFGGWLDIVCMDFMVELFDNIMVVDFNINWDLIVLQFVSLFILVWNDLILILVMLDVGILNGIFISGILVVIFDGEVVFQVCFLVIGDFNECYFVMIQDSLVLEV